MPLPALLPHAINASAALLLVGGSNWCTPDKNPTITITPTTEQIRYDFTQSERDLNKFTIDTVSPYGSGVITDVGGLMKGGIRISHAIKYSWRVNHRLKLACMWVERVDVELHIDPTIYIASEFPRGTCMHNSIMQHEQKHIQEDRRIVNEYSRKMGNSLVSALSRKPIFGPTPSAQIESMKAQVQSHVESSLVKLNVDLQNDRQRRQQAIDSLQEYQRVEAKCKKAR